PHPLYVCCDPLPLSILFPYTTLFRSPGLGGAGVGAGGGLGEPEGGERAAGGEIREPLLLLLLRPEQEDRHRPERRVRGDGDRDRDRKSTRLNSSHGSISYAVFCLKKK